MESATVVKKTRASKAKPAVAEPAKKTRKTKPAKIEMEETTDPVQIVSNVILHLKCTMSDLDEYDTQMNRMMMDPLKYNPDIPPEVGIYTESSTTLFAAEYECNEGRTNTNKTPVCSLCSTQKMNGYPADDDEDTDAEKRELKQRLKHLKVQLYKKLDILVKQYIL